MNTEHQRNSGRLTEHQYAGGTMERLRSIGIPRNSGTREEQRNNGTAKQR